MVAARSSSQANPAPFSGASRARGVIGGGAGSGATWRCIVSDATRRWSRLARWPVSRSSRAGRPQRSDPVVVEAELAQDGLGVFTQRRHRAQP